ncbi:oligosaccharide flippase family protein [Aerococcaceae bacterium WS4759]|uniref:Oligosaccharide flippase family protein n=1 Tax=Fundicoccus ignavus TaxID=2664442 RepID=A0A6I2GM79_9LACT|nr:lipopolysaccharide biosynthesis protein [Fundicoccus ignavus]MRI84625.1 oligosaccharide flippase family protein [Fundicoccus ignavus]
MEHKVNRNSIISALIWKLLERGGAQVIQLLVQIIIARLLSPEEFGTMAIILVFVNLAQVFIQGGFNIALIQKKDSDELDFSSIFYLSLVIASFFYILLFFFAPVIARFYLDEQLIILLRVIGIVLFTGALNTVQMAYVSKYMLFKKSAFCSLLATVISGIIGIAFAYLGIGIWALVFQQISYSVVNSITLWIKIKWRPKLVFSFVRVTRLFSYGSKILSSSLIYRIYLELRTLIIGRIFSSTSLGFYQRGEQIPRVLVNNIDGAIQSVILPSLAVFQDDLPKIKSMIRRSLKTSSYIIFPIMFGLAAVSDTFVFLILGEQWIPTVPFLIIFSLTYSLWPMITINQQPARALGRSDIILKTEIIKRILGLLIILITVPLGVIAIAVGFFIERLIESGINAYPNKKLIDYKYYEQLVDILPSLCQSIIMAIIVYLMNYLEINLLVKLILQIIAGVFIYLALSIIFKNDSFEYFRKMIFVKDKK